MELHEFHARRLPDRLRIPETYDDATLRESISALLHQEDAALLILLVSGEPVGLAELSLRSDVAEPVTVAHTYGYVQSLVVLESWRKRGCGQQLLNAAERWTRDHGGTELRLSVWEFAEGPLPFYETAGFRTLKRELVKAISS